MAFSLPNLPYAHNALEPYIDEQTMHIHHGKHHAAYVNNLNAALEKHPELADWSLEKLMRDLPKVPEGIRTAVRNNGGGHANHSLFWTVMKPQGGGKPSGALAAAIDSAFGSVDALKEKLSAAGVGQFGSGWAWLSVDAGGKLAVEGTPNQDNPWMQGRTPVLGVDVWEHAYYLKYQNVRPEYLKQWWNTVDWAAVAKRYEAARR